MMVQPVRSASFTMTPAGVFFALAATVVWSGNYTVARLLVGEIPPFTLSALRWTVACLCLAPFAWGGLKRELPVIRAHLGYYCCLSFLGVAMFNALVYLAGHTTQAVNMALIGTSSPIFTLIFSRIFFGEALTWPRVAGIMAAVSGIVLLAVRGDWNTLLHMRFYLGDLLMLTAAIGFAAYNIMVRFKPAGTSSNTFLLVTFFGGLVGILPFAVWESLFSGQTLTISCTGVFSVLYLALGASIFCYWCWTKAIAVIGPANSSIIYYSLPLFSGIQAVVFLRETVSWVHYASGFLILAGIVIATKRS